MSYCNTDSVFWDHRFFLCVRWYFQSGSLLSRLASSFRHLDSVHLRTFFRPHWYLRRTSKFVVESMLPCGFLRTKSCLKDHYYTPMIFNYYLASLCSTHWFDPFYVCFYCWCCLSCIYTELTLKEPSTSMK